MDRTRGFCPCMGQFRVFRARYYQRYIYHYTRRRRVVLVGSRTKIPDVGVCRFLVDHYCLKLHETRFFDSGSRSALLRLLDERPRSFELVAFWHLADLWAGNLYFLRLQAQQAASAGRSGGSCLAIIFATWWERADR